MAQLIDIHPVRFNQLTHCGVLDSGWKQIVQCGDLTMFQMIMDICNSEENLVSNGSFQEPSPFPFWFQTGSHWLYNSTLGFYQHTNGTISTLGQAFEVANQVPIRIQFTLEDFSGAVIVQVGDWIESFETGGTYVRDIIASNVSGIGFLIGADTEVKFKDISVFAFNRNFDVRITDRDGSEVMRFNGLDDPDYFNFSNGFMTVTFNWKNGDQCLEDGCYFIEVSDPCSCGQGGFVAMDLITTANQWLYPANNHWLIENGVLNYDSPVAQTESAAIRTLVCPNTTYKITYEIVGITADINVFVKVGDVQGPAHTTDGIKTDIVLTGAGLNDDFQIFAQGSNTNQSFAIIDLKFEALDREFEYVSNPFDLYSSAPCSVVVNGCCDQDCLQSGFDGTGFFPMVRLKALYGQGHYLSTEEIYERSNGKKGMFYYRGREIRYLKFASAKYIHDFMSHFRAYDHCFIDGEAVNFEDDSYPKPSYKDEYDFADVALEVSDKYSLIEKRRTRKIEKTCAPDGQGLKLGFAGPNGNEFILATEDGRCLATG